MLPGDGWAHCARGHRHWGVFGAAGLLVWHLAPDGMRWLLLQRRSWWSHHGGTWSLLGGARMPSESAEQAAGREACEEAGLASSAYRVRSRYVDDHGGWSYTTVLASADTMVTPTDLNAESDEVAWIPQPTVPTLRLHPGFAATWPAIRPLLTL